MGEVGTARLYAIFGGCQDAKQRSFAEGVLLFEEVGFDEFSWQGERNKHGSTCVFALGLMGES
jgi:hypothetical protein